MYDFNKVKGGLYGLIVGDALGVPYEFYRVNRLPAKDLIEFEPPKGFKKSHNVEAGTWSDDSAQALCLLETLVENKNFNLIDFANKLLDWCENGRWAVDNKVFDIGKQTLRALYSYKFGESAYKSEFIEPNGKGNGALMRVLPLVLWHRGSDKELIKYAHMQCLITHGHICNQVCCALYCLVAKELLNNLTFKDAFEKSVANLRNLYSKEITYLNELENSIYPDNTMIGKGTGFVVDCLKSCFMIMDYATSYEEAVKEAVLLGNDTDTTAAVTGGLAGIMFGFENIPNRWIAKLKCKEDIEKLLNALINR